MVPISVPDAWDLCHVCRLFESVTGGLTKIGEAARVEGQDIDFRVGWREW